MTRIFPALFVVALLLPGVVASRCKGEASFAIAECACTVRNRIEAGWNPARVLEHYYASDSRATHDEVATVQAILAGDAPCDPALYFMWSRADVQHLGIGHYPPALVVQNGGRAVMFFDRWFRRGE